MTTDIDPRRLAFGQRVRAIRQARGLTQVEVAEAARLHRVTYQRIERGGPLNFDRLLGIADALHVHLYELFPPPPCPPPANIDAGTDQYRDLVTAAASRVATLSADLNRRLA